MISVLTFSATRRDILNADHFNVGTILTRRPLFTETIIYRDHYLQRPLFAETILLQRPFKKNFCRDHYKCRWLGPRRGAKKLKLTHKDTYNDK